MKNPTPNPCPKPEHPGDWFGANPHICFYFQVHQPYRLRDLRYTEIGNEQSTDYFDHQKNHDVFRKVAEKCYLPANALMRELLNQHEGFRIAYSLSGVFLDQCEEYGPDVLNSFRELANTGKVEFMAETYYHSLSAMHSVPEFCEQVQKHTEKIKNLFGHTPKIFRNTELIFTNEIAHIARMMGFKGILAEGADHILQGRNPNDPYIPPSFYLPDEQYWKVIQQYFPKSVPQKNIHILLKNYRLSDDVAFRFSDKSWIGHPLTAELFTDWLLTNYGHCINLFMDYETFGEHQWEDTGIFDFLRKLPEEWANRGMQTLTPSQVIESWCDRICTEPYSVEQEFDAHSPVSWADMERDLSAWSGNDIQDSALQSLYELEHDVKESKNPSLLETWRKLQTSDHFYYMCTKYWNDGDVHKYFSPYDSPYEAYRRFSHALHDLRLRLEWHKGDIRDKRNRSDADKQLSS
jgi:alpha-amylase